MSYDNSRPLVLYLIHAPAVSIVKIGTTRALLDRFEAIQTCSPVKLEVAGAWRARRKRDELEVHRHFDASRLHGEWFALGARSIEELADEITELRGSQFPTLPMARYIDMIWPDGTLRPRTTATSLVTASSAPPVAALPVEESSMDWTRDG